MNIVRGVTLTVMPTAERGDAVSVPVAITANSTAAAATMMRIKPRTIMERASCWCRRSRLPVPGTGCPGCVWMVVL